MNFSDIVLADHYEYMIIAVDFIIAIAMLTAVGKVTGLVSNVKTVQELSVKDNFAFGISYAAAILAVGIMLTGALSGDVTISLLYEVGIVSAYGVLGIVLMTTTKRILDRVSLPKIAIQEQILKGNSAAGIVDAANMLATAIIVRAVMIWVDTESFSGLLMVLGGFVFSQILMMLVTRYRLFVYASRHNGENLQGAFEAGNIALALRYFGHNVGVALAVTAASGIATYTEGQEIESAILWAGVSLGLTIGLSLLSILARHIILWGINVVEEVDKQKNVGVGFIECMIYISNGVLMVALFGISAS
ncbi:MAG: DUF350 domain-containing protein [Ectothiorhodospiraceae bacterium]|nr:DUF350 domain-containing protein [Ectothiorhodospiraceae bacterium]MBN4053011.1 DUF350 domain-containing protein [Gammaproteobacteria bacterium AH-315-K14]